MSRNPPDPELVALVVQLAATGASHADLAATAGVAESTIRMWLRKYGKGKGLRTEAPAGAKRLLARRAKAAEAPSSDEPPAVVDGASLEATRATAIDALVEARGTLEMLKGIAREAKACGNVTAAQRAARDIGNVITTIARIQRTLGGEGEIRVSKAEIAEAREAVRARMAAVLSAPLLCAHCGRQMRIDWTKG